VGEVVELGYDAVPMIRASKTVCFVHLGAEMTQDEDGGLVWAKQKGTY